MIHLLNLKKNLKNNEIDIMLTNRIKTNFSQFNNETFLISPTLN